MASNTASSIPETEPYRVYIEAASSNPGRSACAVLVTRGDREVDFTRQIAQASYDEALVAGLELALEMVSEKRATVIIYAHRMLLEIASMPWSQFDTKLAARAKEAWAKAVKVRKSLETDKPLPIGVMVVKGKTEQETTDRITKVRKLSYVTAFPEGVFPCP